MYKCRKGKIADKDHVAEMGRLIKAFSEIEMSTPSSCDIAKKVIDVVEKKWNLLFLLRMSTMCKKDAMRNDVLSDLEKVTSCLPLRMLYWM